ncbi:unnamed protein product [Cylindrotheca closterium]|uniref:Uncharacterized protein n=1 Tax=Cylindrotheca closterium TaxID=2856 RepID=A0AAD2FN08_9STRA|nr:unnamed protein product [Cylindrotheca closterium]
MIFTPSSSDSFPLIPATPISSNCGINNNLIIQRPPCEAASIGWSDFAIVENDSFFPKMNAYQTDSSSSDTLDTYMEDSSSTSSQDTDMSLSSTEIRSSASSSASLNQKSVKFSPFLEVRTHSITLGDHPCCTILPVGLDWDYAETENVSLELHEMKKAYRGKARKLSYIERKQLLQEFVDKESLQSTMEQQPMMKKAGSSSRQLKAMA